MQQISSTADNIIKNQLKPEASQASELHPQSRESVSKATAQSPEFRRKKKKKKKKVPDQLSDFNAKG